MDRMRIMPAWRAILLGSALAAPLAALAVPDRARAAEPKAESEGAPPDFTLRVLPLITKAGCNSGQCHGASGGQSGFALSLRGYDPEADYDAIVRERGGRRVDRTDAAHSLLLRKPSMRIPHKGGRKLPEGSEAYEEVRAWIAAGAPRSAADAAEAERRRPVALEVSPGRTLGKLGDAFQLKVGVRLAGGETLEASDVCLYSSNDESIARVDPTGRVEIVGSGETAVLVRYLSLVGFARVGAPFAAPYEPKIRSGDGIDRFIDKKLGEMGIEASPACDDPTFLRRATLDLAGRLPSPEEAVAFPNEMAAGKRAALVERLAASPDAVTRWGRWLGDLCRVREESMGPDGARTMQQFLTDGLTRRRPLDETLRALLTSQGEPSAPGPAAFSLATQGASDQMEFVTRTFLGYRFQCAQCHQHPFDRWSRQDYFGAAAFFARVRRENGRVVLAKFGEFPDPKTGRDAKPKYPGGGVAAIAEGADRREAFADWLLDRDSLRFDRAIANRIWKELLGRGLVEPVDDLRDSNPATHPELLDFLARRFRDGGRDLLGFAAFVASSDAYARASAPRPGAERDDRYASHAILRPLSGPVLLDAIAQVTGERPFFPRAPKAARAQEIHDEDGGAYSLRALGRCPRDGSIDPSSPPSPTISMALHLIHGPLASEWLSAPGGRIAALTKNPQPPGKIADQLFLVSLGRLPSADERRRAVEALGAEITPERVEDLLWSLLASTEFSMNH